MPRLRRVGIGITRGHKRVPTQPDAGGCTRGVPGSSEHEKTPGQNVSDLGF